MKLTFDYIREHGLLLYEFVRGSHCHGINTPTSDLDTGGVYILPNETRLGLGLDYAPFIEDETHDTVWYELNRYAELLIKSNPTVLESLFVDDEFILYEHPCFREFRMKRDMFVTKECFNPFGGYAVAQIKKARGLNKMIVQPIVERKTPIDFCYVVYENDTVPVTDWLSMNGFSENDISLAKMNHARDAYAVFVYPGGFCKPNGNDVHVNNLPKGLTSVATLFFNKDAYSKHCNDYKHYKEWEAKRNPIRYASNLDKNYDAKNMCECMRLMNMCCEIARGEGVKVNRRGIDGDFLLSIKGHNYLYEKLIDIVERKKEEMDDLIAKSTIREKVDCGAVNEIVLNIRETFFK